MAVAKAVKASGANMLRGGAFKPRTSPYDFAGLKAEGLELLKIARQETGLPIVTEIMSVVDLPLFEDVDVIAGGRPEHAELRPAAGTGQAPQAHPPQAGPGQHPEGAADERRVHHGRRQRAGHPLRAGHPHL